MTVARRELWWSRPTRSGAVRSVGFGARNLFVTCSLVAAQLAARFANEEIQAATKQTWKGRTSFFSSVTRLCVMEEPVSKPSCACTLSIVHNGRLRWLVAVVGWWGKTGWHFCLYSDSCRDASTSARTLQQRCGSVALSRPLLPRSAEENGCPFTRSLATEAFSSCFAQVDF